MGSIFREKKVDTTKTTCIEITAESYKCIDISAFVPQCITITSNVPTSELYQEQYDRDPVETTEAPQLQIALINNEAPILNVNMDEDGVYYVTDFDTVYIDITNWNANAEYVNVFSNEDGNDAVIYLDRENERIIWALDDWAWDDTQMWLYAQAKESDKLLSPQSSVTVMQMEQTDQPNLSSWVSQTEQTVLNITILDYDATYTYSDPIVTGGTAVRTDNIIAWTLPDVTADTNHEISITATAPLMYESAAGVSGGSVILNPCEGNIALGRVFNTIMEEPLGTDSFIGTNLTDLWYTGAIVPSDFLKYDLNTPCNKNIAVNMYDGPKGFIYYYRDQNGSKVAMLYFTASMVPNTAIFDPYIGTSYSTLREIAIFVEAVFGISFSYKDITNINTTS